jgi:hypothetical protein
MITSAPHLSSQVKEKRVTRNCHTHVWHWLIRTLDLIERGPYNFMRQSIGQRKSSDRLLDSTWDDVLSHAIGTRDTLSAMTSRFIMFETLPVSCARSSQQLIRLK